MNDIKKLEDENKNLKESLNKLKQNQINEINKLKVDLEKYKKENTQLKLNLDKYQKENDKLKEDLINAKKIISDIKNNQNNQMNNNEFRSLKDEIKKLKNELTNEIKNGLTNELKNELTNELKNGLKNELTNEIKNEIKDLKGEIRNNSLRNMKANYKDIKFVTFVSMDSTVQCGIKSLSKNASDQLKEKLHKKNDNLKDTNNMFIAKSKPILSFEKINENNIRDDNIHQLFKLE